MVVDTEQQVRRLLAHCGLEQWRHYEPCLEPLRAALGSVPTSYPDVPADLTGLSRP
jgi:hypothetical protein